ncbi:MAG: PD-(D/E)XK nuclease family protein [Rhodoluna sp.]
MPIRTSIADLSFTRQDYGKPWRNFNAQKLSPEGGSFERMRVVTVFAAPGAGKTTEIKKRFIEAVNSGVEPDEILVLAATREAANQLRDDLAIELQRATPGSLARTISSFAYGILRIRAVLAGKQIPELISGSEQDRILAELISAEQQQPNQNWPKHVDNQVLGLIGFRAELRDLINAAIEHGLPPSELHKLGNQFKKGEWIASSTLFEKYLAEVAAQTERYDPTQLVREAAGWLSESSNWPEAIAKIKVVLVDDAQELTPAASELLKVLASRKVDLVLIGDPDSSTLGFRSADPRAMTNLANAIAKTNQLAVEEEILHSQTAVRTPAISSALSRVGAQIDTAFAGRQRKSLVASKELVLSDQTGIEGRIFDLAQSETAWLAKRLRELHLLEGVAWAEMAVVARSRTQLDLLSAELSHEGVPVQVIGAQSALRDEFASRILLRIADAVLNDRQPDLQLALDFLTSPLCGLDSLGLRRLRRALRREELMADGKRNSDELLVALFDAIGSAATLKTAEGKKVDKFINLYFQAKDLAADPNQSIEDLLWLLWDKSGLAKAWGELARGVGEVATQANRNLDAAVALFASANRYVERNPSGDAKIFVDQQLALGLPEDTLALDNRNLNSLSLLTPSGLIGRRYRVVALPQLVEGVWPNLRPRSSLLGAMALDAYCAGRIEDPSVIQKSELPDELRMLHKAVGATSEHLLLSATSTDENQVSQFIQLLLGEIPSVTNFDHEQFTLRGMAGALRKQLAQSEGAAATVALGLARLAQAGVAGAHPSSWYGMLPLSTVEALTDEVVVRPSELENFVKCPLHWFLNSHGGKDKTFSATLGSLVHKALELGTEVNEESLWSLVESKWHTLNFEAEWLEQAGQRRAKQMISSMVQYLKKFEADGAKVIGREVSFEFAFEAANVRGQVDRLELYPDGRVMIVDLKTGSKKFTAEEARENAQLGMYQLAFENGAFGHLPEMPTGATLAGAKLLLVSDLKPIEREQDSIEKNQADRQKFENLVRSAIDGMSMNEKVFVARVASHCENENEYGSCKLHLTRAVSYVA